MLSGDVDVLDGDRPESWPQPEKGGKSCSPPGRYIREFLTRILAVVPDGQAIWPEDSYLVSMLAKAIYRQQRQLNNGIATDNTPLF